MQNTNDSVRPIYGELINVYRTVPGDSSGSSVCVDCGYENRVNSLISRIEQATNEDFSVYKITTENAAYSSGEKILHSGVCRSSLAAIIGRIYAKYYPTEPDPLSKQSNTILSQVQHVEQNLNIELKSFSNAIENALESKDLDVKEKNFLKQIKDLVTSAKDIAGVINIIVSLAQSSGFTLEKLTSLWDKIFR